VTPPPTSRLLGRVAALQLSFPQLASHGHVGGLCLPFLLPTSLPQYPLSCTWHFCLSLYLLSTSSRLTQDIRQEIRDGLCLLKVYEAIQRLQQDYSALLSSQSNTSLLSEPMGLSQIRLISAIFALTISSHDKLQHVHYRILLQSFTTYQAT